MAYNYLHQSNKNHGKSPHVGYYSSVAARSYNAPKSQGLPRFSKRPDLRPSLPRARQGQSPAPAHYSKMPPMQDSMVEGRFEMEPMSQLTCNSHESSETSMNETYHEGPPLHQNSSASGCGSTQSTFGSAASGRRSSSSNMMLPPYQQQAPSLFAGLATVSTSRSPWFKQQQTVRQPQHRSATSLQAFNKALAPREQLLRTRANQPVGKPVAKVPLVAGGCMVLGSSSSVASNGSKQRRSRSVQFTAPDDRSTSGTQGSVCTMSKQGHPPQVDVNVEMMQALKNELLALFEAKQQNFKALVSEEVQTLVTTRVNDQVQTIKNEVSDHMANLESKTRERIASDSLALDDRVSAKSSELDARMERLALSSEVLQENVQYAKADFASVVDSAISKFEASKSELEDNLEATKENLEQGRQVLVAEGSRQVDLIKSSGKSMLNEIREMAEAATKKFAVSVRNLITPSIMTVGSLLQRSNVEQEESSLVGNQGRTISPPAAQTKSQRSSPRLAQPMEEDSFREEIVPAKRGRTISPMPPRGIGKGDRSSTLSTSREVRAADKNSLSDVSASSKRGRTISPPPPKSKVKRSSTSSASKAAGDDSSSRGKRGRTKSPPRSNDARLSVPQKRCRGPVKETESKEFSQDTKSSVESAISLGVSSRDNFSGTNHKTPTRPPRPGFEPLELRTAGKSVPEAKFAATPKKTKSKPVKNTKKRGTKLTPRNVLSQDTALSSITATQHEPSPSLRSSTKRLFSSQPDDKENIYPISSTKGNRYSFVTPVGGAAGKRGSTSCDDGLTHVLEVTGRGMTKRSLEPTKKKGSPLKTMELSSSQESSVPMEEIVTLDQPNCSPLSQWTVANVKKKKTARTTTRKAAATRRLSSEKSPVVRRNRKTYAKPRNQKSSGDSKSRGKQRIDDDFSFSFGDSEQVSTSSA